MASTQTPARHSFSEQLADATATAAAATVRVEARRGQPASGIALAADLVVTADHVVDPSREGGIRVGLPDGSTIDASLAGRDQTTDLALLRVAGATLTPARAAPGEPRVGSLGVLVARPGSQPQASLGLVTGLGGPVRTRRGGVLDRFILVDTVMYPGFSGGAFVDPDGAVLGLATSGLSVGGPAIAIPWAVVQQVANTLAEHGSIRRGFLGVGTQPVDLSAAARELAQGQERGLLVVQVADDGPAAKAGFFQGDILVTLDGHSLTNADDLQALLGPNRVGTSLPASVIRAGELVVLTVVIGARDS